MQKRGVYLSNWLFLLLWVIGHGAAWIAYIPAYDEVVGNTPMNYNNLQTWFFWTTMVTALVPGVLIGLMQSYLLPRKHPLKLSGWFWVSLFGWLVSGFTQYMYSQSGASFKLQIYWVLLFLPVAVFQWVLLRDKFQSAWLWILGSGVSGVVFMLVLNMAGFGERSYVPLAGVVQGIITGVVMLAVLAKPRLEPIAPAAPTY
jgi:hypothetical protein